jgi:hypothetical protein
LLTSYKTENIPIAIIKVICIFGINRNFGLVISPKNTTNSATKPLILGKAKEAIEKLLNINMIKKFSIGIDVPPSSLR